MTSLDYLQAIEKELRYQIKMIQNAYYSQLEKLEPIYIEAAVNYMREQSKIIAF